MNQFQFPVFENLCPTWGKNLHLGVRRRFSKGQQVFDISNPINGVYFITVGSVEIILNTTQGPEKVLFYVGEGCIFGEVSCFVAGSNGEARVRARTNCDCYFFSREIIESEIAQNHPRLMIELIQAAAYKIRMYGILLQDSMNNNNFIRVCKMLVYLTQYKQVKTLPKQKQVILQPDMTQNDIAKLMGIHRVTVTKALSRLRSLGVLSHYSKNSLKIDDFPRLLQLIEENQG